MTYVGAATSYEDSENKRARTADCIEAVNAPAAKWWQFWK